MFKIITLALISSVAIATAALSAVQPTDTGSSRSATAGSVLSACQVSEADCRAAVRNSIASAEKCQETGGQGQAKSCVCSRDGMEIARGVGDAARAMALTDVERATMIAEEVAGGAVVCFQAAFAVIIDEGQDTGDIINGSPG